MTAAPVKLVLLPVLIVTPPAPEVSRSMPLPLRRSIPPDDPALVSTMKATLPAPDEDMDTPKGRPTDEPNPMPGAVGSSVTTRLVVVE